MNSKFQYRVGLKIDLTKQLKFNPSYNFRNKFSIVLNSFPFAFLTEP